jgi:hypothetical protein
VLDFGCLMMIVHSAWSPKMVKNPGEDFDYLWQNPRKTAGLQPCIFVTILYPPSINTNFGSIEDSGL